MFYIGIDPGTSGGIAIIPAYDFAATSVHDLGKMELEDVAALFRELRLDDAPAYVLLENPQLPQYNHNISGNNKGPRMIPGNTHRVLGQSVGQMQGVSTAFGYLPNLISPQKWQNRLQCRTGGDKNVSKNLAIRVFPFLNRYIKATGEQKSTITHATADALLIALYAYLEHTEPKYIPNTVRQNVPLEPPKWKNRKKNGSNEPKRTPISDGNGHRSTTTERRLPPRGRRIARAT
jgi:hypothetical protein